MPRFQGLITAAALVVLFQPTLSHADCLLITEVVTDPQADHSENAGVTCPRFQYQCLC